MDDSRVSWRLGAATHAAAVSASGFEAAASPSWESAASPATRAGTSSERIRALVVDPDPLARQWLRCLLDRSPDFEVAGVCSEGREAIAAIRRLQPDLVFLEARLHDIAPLAVLEEAGGVASPCVVCVGSDPHDALKAFEAGALDFLLKPIGSARAARALSLVRERLRVSSPGVLAQRVLALVGELKRKGQGASGRLAVKCERRVLLLELWEIDWIESEGNYARLHLGARSLLVRETLNHLEARLDPTRFLRIHRSYIVNVDRVTEIHPLLGASYGVVLGDGRTRLVLSRSYRGRVALLIGGDL
jgi:two-component system, LytTR family, response regulator